MDINKVIALVRRLNESPSIIKARGKRNTYMGPTGDHSRDKEGNIKASFYKKKSAPQGEKSGEHIPVLNWKGKENKSARYGSQLHRLRPASERLGKKKVKEDWKPEIEHSKLGDAVKKKAEKKRKEAESSLPPHLKLDAMKKAFAHTNEELSPMQDNNLFGNAYAVSKITKKKKKKLKEGRVDASYSGGQVTYSSFYDRAKEARKAMARKSAKKIEYDKKNEAVTSDTRKHGVKFSDKKGTGRIIKGKKHYD